MSRATLRLVFVLVVGFSTVWSVCAIDDVHLDQGVVLGGCMACHAGHGVSRSPLLPAPLSDVCLGCHGSQTALDLQVIQEMLAPGEKPPFLSTVLAQPYVHPLTTDALSQRDVDVVTCTSCHSPHRSPKAVRRGPGGRNVSTRSATELEFEMCNSCHGSSALRKGRLFDVGRLTHPNNRSYHPIQVPAQESSPSLRPKLNGVEINCTDCHGNSDADGPAGPHGSDFPYILRLRYSTFDGETESEEAYGLCYECHDRQRVLTESPFTLHESHVVDIKATCSTCHSPHGSVENRALIRFGEEDSIAGVGPSMATDRFQFVSDLPGSGTCYVTCHGVDHDPKSYGPKDRWRNRSPFMGDVPTLTRPGRSLPGELEVDSGRAELESDLERATKGDSP